MGCRTDTPVPQDDGPTSSRGMGPCLQKAQYLSQDIYKTSSVNLEPGQKQYDNISKLTDPTRTSKRICTEHIQSTWVKAHSPSTTVPLALERLNSSLEAPVQNHAPSLLPSGIRIGEWGKWQKMERGENTKEAAWESAPDDLGNKICWWFVRQGRAAPNKQSWKCAPS